MEKYASTGEDMEEIMQKYSTTFYACIKGWPDEIKEDIYKLYAYLRVCDEMVEGVAFTNYRQWRQAIESFYEVSEKYEFEGQWLADFHLSMYTDIVKKEHTVESMLEYCKGSAESVGLMMARILGCPPEADEYARALGRAYQIINFIRDYDEDVAKGYHYITDDHALYTDLFIKELKMGIIGMVYIPEHLREPIHMANRMYVSLVDTKPTWDNMWICNCVHGHQNCKCDGKTGKKVRE